MNREQPCAQSGDLDLDDLSVSVLEDVFADLMTVKYPGIERVDIDRLLAALNAGDLVLVEQIEADIAVKSARWLRAALDIGD